MYGLGRTLSFLSVLLAILNSCSKLEQVLLQSSPWWGNYLANYRICLSKFRMEWRHRDGSWATNKTAKVGEITGMSGSFRTGPITTSTSGNVGIPVTGTSSGESYTAHAAVLVWSPRQSFLSWDRVRSKTATWLMDSYTITVDGSATPGSLDCNTTIISKHKCR